MTIINKKTTYLFSAILASAIFPSITYAQEDEATVELAPFIVSDSGYQRVLQINERDLEVRQANDLEDALSLDPSVTVGGSNAIAQKIYVRNLGEGMLNVSIDGATQSGSLFHHIGRIAIEPELLKQVEVQPGIGNATDGPGALGGAIRFITKDPTDLLRGNQRSGGMLKAGYFDNTSGYKASITGFGKLDDNWSGMVSFVSSEHDEIEDGNGNKLNGSETKQRVLLTKLVGQFENGHAVRFSFENLEEEGDKLRRPEWAPGPGNPTFPMDAERRTAIFGYSYRPNYSDWLDLQFNLSLTDGDILQIGPWGPYNGAIESLQLDIRNTSHMGVHKVVYGIDYREDEVEAGDNTNPSQFSEDSSVTGFYLQDFIQVSDKLMISGGARLDFYRLDDQEDQNFRNDGFSPNLGFVYDISPEFSLNGGVATAFRGPEINDAFRIDISSNDPDLDAEEAENYELGFNYHKDGLEFGFGAYENKIDNTITNTLPWRAIYVNKGDLNTDGIFTRLSYSTESIHFGLQYNNANTAINDQIATRYQYSSVVSMIGNTWVADISWRALPQLDIGWNTRLVEGIDNILVPMEISFLEDSRINKPGYVTHDFYARWVPSFLDNIVINLTVKNLFDKQYLSHGSVENLTAIPDFEAVIGAPEPGRDIRISATARF